MRIYKIALQGPGVALPLPQQSAMYADAQKSFGNVNNALATINKSINAINKTDIAQIMESLKANLDVLGNLDLKGSINAYLNSFGQDSSQIQQITQAISGVTKTLQDINMDDLNNIVNEMANIQKTMATIVDDVTYLQKTNIPQVADALKDTFNNQDPSSKTKMDNFFTNQRNVLNDQMRQQNSQQAVPQGTGTTVAPIS